MTGHAGGCRLCKERAQQGHGNCGTLAEPRHTLTGCSRAIALGAGIAGPITRLASPENIVTASVAAPPSAGRASASRIRVASVPAGHVYVRHLGDPGGGDVVARLDDPLPPGSGLQAGQWWPPAMLSPSWVMDHHREFDVFHIQFGFDAQEPRCLNALVQALRSVRKPLLYTVHDLRNPHHPDPRAHDAQLDVLIPQSDGLVTLTAGRRRRWSRAGGAGRWCFGILTSSTSAASGQPPRQAGGSWSGCMRRSNG